MKISKLFHWLYAILMLLPFAFFVPAVFYYAFNDNATMQSVEVPKTETIAVDFNQINYQNFDFSPYNTNNLTIDYQNDGANFKAVSLVDNLGPGDRQTIRKACDLNGRNLHYFIIRFDFSSSNNSTPYFEWFRGLGARSLPIQQSNTFTVKFQLSDSYVSGNTNMGFGTSQPLNIGDWFEYSNMNIFDLTDMGIEDITIQKFNQIFTNSYYPYTESELKQITYDTGETEQLVQNTDIINYAWESIWDLPLFNWCKVSFVSVPFTYITGLFGLAASNSFNYVFTYFASMSIIWLVFDVIMYVPLLVHRWLDKGIVE